MGARSARVWPQALLRYPLRTSELVRSIRGPLMLIPFSHSDTLKMLVPHGMPLHIADAAHNDLQDFDAYLTAYARALADL